MEQNKANHPLQDILLAREHYFPATIVEMCDPEIVWDGEFPLVWNAHTRNDDKLQAEYTDYLTPNTSKP